MKKTSVKNQVSVWKSAMIGLVIGVFCAVGLIAYTQINNVAYGDDETSTWNRVVSGAQKLSWGEIFSFNEGQDLYLLVYRSLVEDAKDDALMDMAKNSGLTVDEAEAVLAGSLVPILSNPDYDSQNLSQAEALTIISGYQQDFNDLREIYQIEKEVEVAVMPSEIFANGDLSDSGFDLIVDLNMIEEILFLETDDVSVGTPYGNALSEPFPPSSKVGEFNEVAPSAPAAVRQIDSISENLSALLNEDGDQVPVAILEEDICLYEDPLQDALNEFDNANSGAGDVNGGDGSGDDDGQISVDDDNNPNVGEDGKLIPSNADEWLNQWCPGAGAESSAASVCISFEYVDEVYRSYQPGQSCILCEVDKINEYMDRTLSHSLIPNKATGNLLESGKCKEAPNITANIITIWNPIPSPPNDDVVFGKNIFEEWNNFVKRYDPLLLGTIPDLNNESSSPSETEVLQKRSETVPTFTSNIELLSNVNSIVAAYQSEALKNINDYENADLGTNDMLYNHSVLQEIQEMNRLFNALFNTFNSINEEVLPEIQDKPTLG